MLDAGRSPSAGHVEDAAGAVAGLVPEEPEHGGSHLVGPAGTIERGAGADRRGPVRLTARAKPSPRVTTAPLEAA